MPSDLLIQNMILQEDEPIEPFSVPYKEGVTNQVLVEQQEPKKGSDGKTTVYYLPTYVRCKVKDVDRLYIAGLEADIKATILFTFYYGNVPASIIDRFVCKEKDDRKPAILIQFNQMAGKQLKVGKGITLKHNKEKKEVTFIVRSPITVELTGQVFLSPFEILSLELVMTIQPVSFEIDDRHKVTVKFNCMDTQTEKNLDFSQRNCQFGNYTLAPYFAEALYTMSDDSPFSETTIFFEKDKQKKDSQSVQPGESMLEKVESRAELNDRLESNKDLTDDQPSRSRRSSSESRSEKRRKSHKSSKSHSKMSKSKEQNNSKNNKKKHFQYVHYRIPLYKYPGASILTIFIPLWLLGLINISVFFQDASLGGRIGSIATLALAYIAFIPVIQKSIPETPGIILCQILILMQTAATVLTLIQSIQGRNKNYTETPYDETSDPFFIIVVALNCFTFLTEVILFAFHKLWWEKVYLTQKPRKEGEDLVRKNWSNPACDEYFKSDIRKGKIKAI